MGDDKETAASDGSEYPLTGIKKPGEHDVLCGRGGGTNNHSGNVKFRQLVNEHKLRYLAASKVEKPKVAREVVKLWRGLDPPGRFLSRSEGSAVGPGSVKAEGNVWHDVGDKKAREKASQCLRERTPDVIPFVKELQRQQDLLTGHGLRYVEEQMRRDQQAQMVGGHPGQPGAPGMVPASPGTPGLGPEDGSGFGGGPPVDNNGFFVQNGQQGTHPGSELPPDVANAFSPEHHANFGFHQQGGMPPNVAQMQQQQQLQFDQSFNPNMPPQQQMHPNGWGEHLTVVKREDGGAALVNHQFPGQNGQLPQGYNPNLQGQLQLPDEFPAPGEDEMTLEEYQKSLEEYMASEGGSVSGSSKELAQALEEMRANSWVKSFHSVETSSLNDMSSAGHSLMGPGEQADGTPRDDYVKSTSTRSGRSHGHRMSEATLPHSNKDPNTIPEDSAPEAVESMSRGDKLRSSKVGSLGISTMSGMSGMSGVSLFSDVTDHTAGGRSAKMGAAKGLKSDLSMMSELTDLSEALGSMDLGAMSTTGSAI